MTPAETFPGARTYDPPRRIVFEPGTYTGYRVNRLGTVLRTKKSTLTNVSGATASAGRSSPDVLADGST